MWYCLAYNGGSSFLKNRQGNDNLEAMAKQLYDYWFVQFDFPNDEGKPYKSSGGEMVWNEKLKREIPKEWDVNDLCHILELLKDGTHNPPKRKEKGIALLTGTMFGRNFLDYSKATYIDEKDYENIHKQYMPKAGDIIMTKIGTLGNINILRDSDIPLAIHCNSALMRFPNEWGQAYPFMTCKSSLFYARLKAVKGQSIQEFVSLDKIGSIKIEIPSMKIISLFNQQIMPILNEQMQLSLEIDSLIKQRDELLPLLMNGQATVNYHLSDD